MYKIINRYTMLLLFLSFCSVKSFAFQYPLDISNCSVVKIGAKKWQAKFTLSVQRSSTSADQTSNFINAFVPTINTSSKKPNSYINQRSTNVEFSNLATPSRIFIQNQTSALKILSSVGDQNILTSGGDFSIDFTQPDDAYPAFFMIYDDRTTLGNTYNLRFYIYPNLNSCFSSPPKPEDIPSIDELDPPEPNFKLKTAIWDLETLDIDDLPSISTTSNGINSKIKNSNNGEICVSYVTAGVKSNSYALTISNDFNSFNGKNAYIMKGPDGSQLPYQVGLLSNDGITSNNFNFPSESLNFVKLSQNESSSIGRSEMCWSPSISLYKNSLTLPGVHTDTIHLMVTPKA